MSPYEIQTIRKLIFRCDGAALPEIGTGHIVRNIAIADCFVARKICHQSEISFVLRTDGPFSVGCDLVKQSGYQIEIVDDDRLEWNSPEEAKVLIDFDPTLLIIDRLSTELAWMTNLKSSLRCVVSMDDTGDGASLADVVINAILHDIPVGESRYIGYDYLFFKSINASVKIEVPEKANRIVASFGGYDHRNLMGFFLNNLQDNNVLLENYTVVELLVGAESNELIERWTKQAEQVSLKYDIHVRLMISPPDFLERLAQADLAVLSGGLTIFDAVSLGVPSIGLPQYRHQLNTIRNLEAKVAVRAGSIEMDLDQVHFARIFDQMMCSREERYLLKKLGPSLIDSKGSERVIDILSSLVY